MDLKRALRKVRVIILLQQFSLLVFASVDLGAYKVGTTEKLCDLDVSDVLLCFDLIHGLLWMVETTLPRLVVLCIKWTWNIYILFGLIRLWLWSGGSGVDSWCFTISYNGRFSFPNLGWRLAKSRENTWQAWHIVCLSGQHETCPGIRVQGSWSMTPTENMSSCRCCISNLRTFLEEHASLLLSKSNMSSVFWPAAMRVVRSYQFDPRNACAFFAALFSITIFLSSTFRKTNNLYK